MYTNIPNQIIVNEGIFAEKLPMLIAEKKKGKKNTRYITAMDIHMKISLPDNSLSRLKRKKARRTIPAPTKKRISLKSSDCILVMFYSG
jgi:hypothetical protein